MCWSARVSAAFAACEALVLCFCWWRNKLHDRRHVVGHVPLALQEVGQALLWTQMRPAEDSPSTCAWPNRALSFALVVIVHGVPLAFSLKAYVGMEHSPGAMTLAAEPFRRRLKATLRQSVAWGLALPALTGALMLLGVWTHVCTLRGPHGHQVWPLVMMPVPRGVEYAEAFRLAMWAAYFVVVSQPLYMDPAPDVAVVAFSVVGPFTVLGLVLWLGDEWGSSWCFLASLLCVFYVLAPLPPFRSMRIAPPNPMARALFYEYAGEHAGESRELLQSARSAARSGECTGSCSP